MVWRQPQSHADDSYPDLTNITGFDESSRKKIKDPNLPYAVRPVPHSDDYSVPKLLVNKGLFFLIRCENVRNVKNDVKTMVTHAYQMNKPAMRCC